MKIVGFLLAVITPLLSLVVATPFSDFDKNVEIAENKVGGFMKGVCHADPQYDLLNEAGIEWFRDDIPFPFEKDGSISNVKLLRGIGGGCEEASVEMVKNMPKWKPAKQRGKPVRCQFTLPIKFELPKDKE
jgi:hypothetical protein